MSNIWSPTSPECRPVVLGPGARTVTRWSTGRLLIPVTPTPLAGLGSGTARLIDTILLTPTNVARPTIRPPRIFRYPGRGLTSPLWRNSGVRAHRVRGFGAGRDHHAQPPGPAQRLD